MEFIHAHMGTWNKGGNTAYFMRLPSLILALNIIIIIIIIIIIKIKKK